MLLHKGAPLAKNILQSFKQTLSLSLNWLIIMRWYFVTSNSLFQKALEKFSAALCKGAEKG
jgi:hypothetical protein